MGYYFPGGSLRDQPRFLVSHRVYLDAKHHVERQAIPFFDFFRHCAFGFVAVGEKKGFFAHVVVDQQGQLQTYCNCTETDFNEPCSHGFALYLKLINWPLGETNLSEVFEDYPLCHFFKAAGRKLYNQPLNLKTNPCLDLSHGVCDPRLTNYWDFTLDKSRLVLRDQRSLEKAKSLCRTGGELAMIKKKFPSPKVLFEDSRLYALCKLFFFLEQKSELNLRFDKQPDHQVKMTIGYQGHLLFSWVMPIDLFLKGIQKQWDYWQPFTYFEIRKQGMPLSYRIGFTGENNLEVEPMVLVAPDTAVTPNETKVQQSKNLFYHDNLGYFRIQTGLSPFEMSYSDSKRHQIDSQHVNQFLKEHRQTLETLDRGLMDEEVFGEVVTDRFNGFKLDLQEFRGDHFKFQFQASLGEQELALADLQQLLAQKGRYRKVAGKLFDTASYDGGYLDFLGKRKGNEDLSVSDLFRMMALFKDRLEIRTTEFTKKVFQLLSELKRPECPTLEHTELDLRPYQTLGFEWLYFLYSFGLGGLLCDQMGLGKTHQGMALIAAILKENPEAKILIIAPVSVIYHWSEKLERFCPGLKTAQFHGSSRDFKQAKKAQITISTFATLRNDADQWNDHFLDLILFDEIQNLKNDHTKSYKAAFKLKARCRIGLTGTPIENHIGELKNLMDLVFPGYMGSKSMFKRYFADPILKHNSNPAKKKMQAMVHPFLLRRSKKQVLPELPDKTEDLRLLNLDSYERELYNEVLFAGKKKLPGGARNPIALHVFQLIDQLKQICNHPALYFKNESFNGYPSTKWSHFTELMEEALASGEKIVIFTQYLGMIDLFKRYLESLGTGYSCVTGKTKDRAREQHRFMTDPQCKVFLGSLRASGSGIDLTEASILIHYDRWWNPAVEEQATDRIHRFGQKKNVQIYKFRTEKTVEERIDRIISRKRHLLDEVVGFDSDTTSKAFTVEELLEILS